MIDVIDAFMMLCLVSVVLCGVLLAVIQIKIMSRSSLTKYAFQPLNNTELRLRKYAGLLFFVGITMLFLLGYIETIIS
jgi:hypothetical protein